MSAVLGQSPPQLLSVTPADGATGVATNSALVFVFDQDMNVHVFPFASVAGIIGNVTFAPAQLNLFGTWGADKRTLTFKASTGLPYDTTISWTLNPPGNSSFRPFSSASGQVLGIVSGSFHTAPYVPPPPIPKIVSVTPTNNATQVAPISPVVFVFDQDMDTSVPLEANTMQTIGNYAFNGGGTMPFIGTWGTDKRTLTFQPPGQLALYARISWTLNPFGAAVPLRSAAGQPLAQTFGSYQTITDTGGNPAETCTPSRTDLGQFTLTRTLRHLQTSPTEVVEKTEAAGEFEVSVGSPTSGGRKTRSPTISAVAVTLPDNQSVSLTHLSTFQFSDSAASEAAFEAKYPSGTYTLRLEETGQPELTYALIVPSTFPSVPKLANYAEAQSINPAEDFALRWNAWAPEKADAFIRLVITDQSGKLIFQAPNPCMGRDLSASDTSVVIPANYLRPGLNYQGRLEFGSKFYHSTNDLPQFIGEGINLRRTDFNLATLSSIPVGSGTSANPATFSAYHVVSGRALLELTLSGTPGKTYNIQSSLGLSPAAWTQNQQVTMDPTGKGTIDISVTRARVGTLTTQFFRAVAAAGNNDPLVP